MWFIFFILIKIINKKENKREEKKKEKFKYFERYNIKKYCDKEEY